MELHQLRAFLAVAREGSVSAAARRVLRTQPAVTMALQKLQRELGVRLLERAGRRVRLTRAGEAMAARTAPLVEELDAVARDAQRAEEAAVTDRVRVASDDDGLTWLLPQAVRPVLRDRPELRVEVQTADGPGAVAMVGQGRADLALVRLLGAPAGMAVTTVLRSPRTLVVPRALGLVTEAGPPDLEALAAHPLLCSTTRPDLAREMEAMFAGHGLIPEAVVHLPEWETVRRYVGLGVGIAVVPGYCKGRQDRRLETILAARLFGEDVYRVVTRREPTPGPAADRLARQIVRVGGAA